jgi:hypothetical protein
LAIARAIERPARPVAAVRNLIEKDIDPKHADLRKRLKLGD